MRWILNTCSRIIEFYPINFVRRFDLFNKYNIFIKIQSLPYDFKRYGYSWYFELFTFDFCDEFDGDKYVLTTESRLHNCFIEVKKYGHSK